MVHKRYNRRKIFIVFGVIIPLLFLSIFLLVKHSLSRSIVFENENITITEEAKEDLVIFLDEFEDSAKNSYFIEDMDIDEYIEKYPFSYKRGFSDEKNYVLYLPYKEDVLLINSLDENRWLRLADFNSKDLYFQTEEFKDKYSKAHASTSPKLKTRGEIAQIEQGDMAYLIFKNVKVPEYLKVTFQGKALDYFKLNDGSKDTYVAIIPSTYESELGKMPIEFSYSSKFMPTVHMMYLTVKERGFSQQRLNVSHDMEKEKRTEEARKEFASEMKGVFDSNTYNFFGDMDKFLSGFELPCYGFLTTEYGAARYINDELSPYTHTGLDIACLIGTPVSATAEGKVVFADELTLTGNTVVINHGFNIYSSYYHMNSIDCKEGDIVEAGQKIGESGTTGFSTGPHLHFEISYKDKRMEAGHFLYGEAVTYDNYENLFESKLN